MGDGSEGGGKGRGGEEIVGFLSWNGALWPLQSFPSTFIPGQKIGSENWDAKVER